MWWLVFLFPTFCRSTTYSQGSDKSSAPEETFQRWLGLVVSLWKPLKVSPASLFWWNSISRKKKIEGSFFLALTVVETWPINQTGSKVEGHCLCRSTWGIRSCCVRPAQACHMGRGGTLLEECRLKCLCCYTLLGAQDLSWSSDTREMSVRAMLHCMKGAVPFPEWGKLVKSTLK